MKDLLKYLVTKITGLEKITIDEEESDGFVKLLVKAETGKAGLIIGKGGKTIRIIRNLLRVKATLLKKGVNVSVEESE